MSNRVGVCVVKFSLLSGIVASIDDLSLPGLGRIQSILDYMQTISEARFVPDWRIRTIGHELYQI